jgi:type IV secretory pathway VirB10-like protein
MPPGGDPREDWGAEAYPRIPPPPALPSIGPDGRPLGQMSPMWTYAVVFLVAMSVVVSAGLLVHHFVLAPIDETSAPAAEVEGQAPPAAEPDETPPAEPPSTATTPGSASAAPSTAEPSSTEPEAPEAAAATGAEGEARAALDDLRDGVRECVTHNIGVLPGTSIPVPARLSSLAGGYRSRPHVWRTPVFHCTKFSIDGPQRFQIQWQNESAKTTGRGVAWLDDDDDGKADRSLSFSARLVKRRQVELGPIEIDPEPRAILAR